jgi:hypothetical protein
VERDDVLHDLETVDVLTPIPPDGLFLGVMDVFPWADADSDDRFEQFQKKLEAYCRYVDSQNFSTNHPNVDRSKLVISVIAIAPCSDRMKKITAVYTPSDPSYQIPVRFPPASGEPNRQPKKKPWWKFWA